MNKVVDGRMGEKADGQVEHFNGSGQCTISHHSLLKLSRYHKSSGRLGIGLTIFFVQTKLAICAL